MPKEATLKEVMAAHAAGYDAGLNGTNNENSDGKHFATPEQSEAWEGGKTKGRADLAKRSKS